MPLDYVNIIVKRVLNIYPIASAVFNIQLSHIPTKKNFAAKLMCFGFYVRVTVMELCVKMCNKYYNCDLI